jgi:hypothetical protein
MATFTGLKPAATFRPHILHVLFMRAEEKMSRIYTRRIVAFVQYKKPVWNWPFHQEPGETMSLVLSALKTYLTISPIAPGAHKLHALTIFNGLPKQSRLNFF